MQPQKPCYLYPYGSIIHSKYPKTVMITLPTLPKNRFRAHLRQKTALLFWGVLLNFWAGPGSLLLAQQAPSQPGYNPGQMGPLGLPPPEIAPAELPRRFSVTLAAEGYYAPQESSLNPFLALEIPVAPGRVLLRAWYRPVEVWRTETALQLERFAENTVGANPGDLYLSTLVQLLRQGRWPLSAALDISLKTTTGKGRANARHINAPAYWMGLTLGRKWSVGIPRLDSVHLTGQAGFLAWQTGEATQNDAPYYGLEAAFSRKQWTFRVGYGGYVGWQDNGDAPQVVRVGLDKAWEVKKGVLALVLRYRYALQHTTDYGLRVGVRWSLPWPEELAPPFSPQRKAAPDSGN